MKTIKTKAVDARTLRAGDLIDRGANGRPLVREVVRVRQTIMTLPIEGFRPVRVTEVLHRKPGEIVTTRAAFAHGATVRLIQN